MGHFIDELKRRNVVRVGVAYIVVSWLAIQVGEVVLPTFGAPEWVFKTILFLVVLGFPFALILAWAFEITPDGVKKTRDVDVSASITPSTGRKLNAVIIASLTVALVYFVWESRFAAEPAPPPEAANAETAVPDTQEEAAQGPEKSIAVLPFDDLSPDSDHAWFADGLAEEILNSLARAPDLLVAARTSSFAYKGTTKDVPTIAAELGVEHVLEGSVRRSDQRLRVTAQLIRASDGFHLWSETYDRSVADMIEIQENVAIEIARALQTAMDPETLGKMLSAGTRSIPAYEAYLEGLAFGISTVSTGDMYEYVSALSAFERAVELDPEFGEGYLQLAYFWSGQLNTANIEHGFLDLDQQDMLDGFNDAISNAIRFARNDPLRTKYQALEAAVATRPERALRMISGYLEAYPNDRDAQGKKLELLALLGRYDDLEAALDQYADSSANHAYLANNIVLFSLHVPKPELIRRHALRAIEIRPDDVFIAYQAHRALLWSADLDRATLLLPAIRASDLPESVRLLAELRQACAEHRDADARRMFDRIETEFADDRFMLWIGRMLRDDADAANELLRELDESEDYRTLYDYVAYSYFDPTPFPNLMQHLESQNAAGRILQDIPYRCKMDEAI